MGDIKNNMNFKKIGLTVNIKVIHQGRVILGFLISSTLYMLESTPRSSQ